MTQNADQERRIRTLKEIRQFMKMRGVRIFATQEFHRTRGTVRESGGKPTFGKRTHAQRTDQLNIRDLLPREKIRSRFRHSYFGSSSPMISAS